MSSFPVGLDKETQLAQAHVVARRARDLISKKRRFRSGAAMEDKNVNKSATCVMLLHRPTGLQVKCQTTRQQGAQSILPPPLLLDKKNREA